jgi:hypothetical protein
MQRDVAARGGQARKLALLASPERGPHDIEMRLEQVDGTPFVGAESAGRLPAEVR